MFMLKALSIEKELSGLREGKLKEREEVVARVDAEDEIERIIKMLDPKDNKVEEIKFVKVPCKSEAILQKFDLYYTCGGAVGPFDFESARQAIISGIDTGMDKETQEQKNALQKILGACWEIEPNLPPQEVQQFDEIVKSQSGRKLFCECFNVFRKKGLFSLSHKAYALVSKLLYIFANHVWENSDFTNVAPVIILSETFYTLQVDRNGLASRVYLQDALSKHPCFKSQAFWNALITHPLNGEMQKPAEVEPLEERKFREMHEVFSKLGAHAHNMLQFGMEKQLVEEIIFKHAKDNSLSEYYKNAIQVWLMKR